MKKITLWGKNRFKDLENERRVWLENLSLRKAVKLQEMLTRSSLIWELRKNFLPDNPVCLKDSLKMKGSK
jgi:hypothetical protein